MRLDIEIVKRKLARSRAQAQMYIDDSQVMVNNILINKANKRISEKDEITILNKYKYVSRGGIKLEQAIKVFDLEKYILGNSNCLDIGSSTGGFTDCLLQYGATHVTAIDVGTEQMDKDLRKDRRVTLYENTDIRKFVEQYKMLIDESGDKQIGFDLIVIDVSFISLTIIIKHLRAVCVANGTQVLALIKPQFEVGKSNLDKRGVVKTLDINGNDITEIVYGEVIKNIKKSFENYGFTYINHIDSPITGGDGNKEFLIHAIL